MTDIPMFLSGSRRSVEIIFPAGHAMKPTVSAAAAGGPQSTSAGLGPSGDAGK
jgi:hypothetical protein